MIRVLTTAQAALLAVGALLLTGAAAAQTPSPPARPAVPAATPEGALLRVSGPLSLEEAVRIALRESPAVRGAAAQVEASLARVEQARAAERPTVSTTTFASAGNAENILPGAESVEPRMWMGVPRGLFLDQNVLGMVPLYTGGRLRALARRAGALRDASRAELEAARQEVALLTRVAYREAVARRSLIAVAEAAVTATEERLRRARLMFEEGRVPLVNVRREEAELAAARQEAANARRDLEVSFLQLKAVIGVDLAATIELAEPQPFPQGEELFAPGRLPGSLPELIALAERQRPELQAAARRAAGERAAAEGIRALYRPQVSAMAMGDLAIGSGDGFNVGVTVGAVASLPVLDGGLRRAQLREAEAMRREREEERRQAALRVGQELGTALANLRAAGQNVKTARVGLVAAEEDYRLALARYEAGRSPLIEVLDAQAALTRARTAEVQALFEASVARDRLLRAVGSSPGP